MKQRKGNIGNIIPYIRRDSQRERRAHTDQLGIAGGKHIFVLPDGDGGMHRTVIDQHGSVLPGNLISQLLCNRAQRNHHTGVDLCSLVPVNLDTIPSKLVGIGAD
ncbi:hypothetical protein SDC9_207051 [bioreactor metagenome]|uniref:Uncharacterized protein n=1 Tax=bioreactor metagenome TaxID=1076179 RepID=A0A645J859_9ZZZZ